MSLGSVDEWGASRSVPGGRTRKCLVFFSADATACAKEKPEEEKSMSDGELRLWDYRLLKIFFVL